MKKLFSILAMITLVATISFAQPAKNATKAKTSTVAKEGGANLHVSTRLGGRIAELVKQKYL